METCSNRGNSLPIMIVSLKLHNGRVFKSWMKGLGGREENSRGRGEGISKIKEKVTNFIQIGQWESVKNHGEIYGGMEI